jgi:hypothetical protein
MNPTKEQHKMLFRSQKKSSRWKSPNLLRLIRARQIKSKVKSMLIIFFDNEGIVHKECVLAGQTSVPHTTVTFYDHCMKMCKDFTPNFGGRRTGCCIMTTHHLALPFSPGNFLLKNNMNVVHHPPYFSLFPQLKIKLKGCHFDTIEVMDAESQAVLNTLTERNFQDPFKNGRSDGNGTYTWKGTTLRVMMANRPKVSFWPVGSTSPGN